MTARFTTNLVLGFALSAVAAGCTVHTYSARPEYPSTAFASQPARYEDSYRSDRRSHERDSDRPETYQPTDRPTTHRPSTQHSSTQHSSTTRTGNDRTTHVATHDTKGSTASHGGSNSSSAQKPRVEKDEPVALLPAKPEKAKTKRGGAQPFAERLKKLVDKKNQEVAQQEKQRRARMRALGEAAVKND
jgi:hypothetical protein